MLFLIDADSSFELPDAGLAGGTSCAHATPPNNTKPAQPAEHLLRHDFRVITFPRELNIAQAV
jgi:hypothetical protein